MPSFRVESSERDPERDRRCGQMGDPERAPDPLWGDPADPARAGAAAHDRLLRLCDALLLPRRRGRPGRGYDGSGWTGTLLEAMENIDRRAVLAGDIVVWGEYPGHHCAVVLEPGDDPWLASHGRERGPIEIRFSTESRYQPADVTWLS